MPRVRGDSIAPCIGASKLPANIAYRAGKEDPGRTIVRLQQYKHNVLLRGPSFCNNIPLKWPIMSILFLSTRHTSHLYKSGSCTIRSDLREQYTVVKMVITLRLNSIAAKVIYIYIRSVFLGSCL